MWDSQNLGTHPWQAFLSSLRQMVGLPVMWRIWVVLALAMLIPVDVLAQGCAMCKTALSGPEDPLAQGIFYSAMLMMSMPFVLFVSIGGWIFYTYRHASRSPHPPASVIPFGTTHTKQTRQKEDLP